MRETLVGCPLHAHALTGDQTRSLSRCVCDGQTSRATTRPGLKAFLTVMSPLDCRFTSSFIVDFSRLLIISYL